MIDGRAHIGDVFINHYSSHPTFRIYLVLYSYRSGRDSMYRTLHANGHLGSLYASSVKHDPEHERIGHINVKEAVRDLFRDYLPKEVE